MTKLELIEMLKDCKDDEQFIVNIYDKDFIEEDWNRKLTDQEWASVVASSWQICWAEITDQVDCLVDLALRRR